MLRCLPLGDETERMRIGIALQEALDNAYYHGNLEVGRRDSHEPTDVDELAAFRVWVEPFVHRRIHVHADINRERARFVIRDDGSGFDISAVKATDGVAKAGAGRGRGITMMKSIMDEVIYNEKGNEVTLVRNAVLPDDDD
jgi:anti-sigma regulatory factor (Ser/Thr protein kinase)